MSFFESFLGNAAGAGAQMIGDQMKSENLLKNEREMLKMREELALERTRTIAELADKRNADMGAKIQEESGRMNQDRITAAAESDPEIGKLSPEEKEMLSKSSPKELKGMGIIGRTRAQEYDDKISAAEKLGALDHAKEFRSQQDVEVRRDSEERRMKNDESRSAAAAAETSRKEKHDEAWRIDQDKDRKLAERRVEALIAKQAGGSTGAKVDKVMSFLESQRKDVATEAGALEREMREQIKAVKFPKPGELEEIKKSYAPQVADLAKRRDRVEADFAEVRGRFGLSALAGDDEKPTPAQSTKPKAITEAEYKVLPSGTKYQHPDGTMKIKK